MLLVTREKPSSKPVHARGVVRENEQTGFSEKEAGWWMGWLYVRGVAQCQQLVHGRYVLP